MNVALKMTNREVDGVWVVSLDGRIVLGEESNALRKKLKSLVAEGKKKIVLNMNDIKNIDSSGLGMLVAVACERENSRRVVVPVPSRQELVSKVTMRPNF